MNIAPKPPLARQGQKLASHGRYGDTELVHMNPYEVQGLAAMSPTGQLTKNPVTGQPEAFLPFLAPLIGKALGTKLLAGKVGAGLAGAIGSGLGTFAESGSLEKGLVSGLTGFGLGKIFGAGAEAVNQKATFAGAELSKAQEGLASATEALQEAGQRPFDASKLVGPLTPEQSAFDVAQDTLGSARDAFTTASREIPFSERLSAFAQPEGRAAMIEATKDIGNILPVAVGLGQRGAIEQRETMERIAQEQSAENERYKQGFRNALTDALGMARGSNPNPYMGNYANGGIVGMQTGGLTDEDNEVPGDFDYDVDVTSGIAGYGIDPNTNRYFIKPAKGSGAERQSFLRGFEKQDPPTDYRHGFEEEFQFFDFIKDRPIDRYLDAFGAGPSDYLAGLLAVDQETQRELGTPTAPGTQPLADYTTTRGQQFSGVDNFSDMGVDTFEPIVAPTPVTPPPTVTPPTVTPPPPPSLPPTTPDPTFMDAIEGLGIELDQDYDRPEGRQVYDVLEQFDAFGDEDVSQLADYFGVTDEFAQENIDVIRRNRATADLLDDAIAGGIEQVDPGEQRADPFTQEEIDAVFNLIKSNELSLEDAAEYFQIPLEEAQATYDYLVSTGMKQGGMTHSKNFVTPFGMIGMANGGLADMPVNNGMMMSAPDPMMMEPEAMAPAPVNDMDFPQLVEMTIQAIRGNVENADAIINQFIEEYGVEEFRRLREAVLQTIVPESQTEGMIEGSSGGMDDEVMGMIGEEQPVAVSPGEYIVAADVVSGLGDGNSDAGAEALDEMMQNVRNARSGGVQPQPINKRSVMPA